MPIVIIGVINDIREKVESLAIRFGRFGGWKTASSNFIPVRNFRIHEKMVS
jgi:hypothetical protein